MFFNNQLAYEVQQKYFIVISLSLIVNIWNYGTIYY